VPSLLTDNATGMDEPPGATAMLEPPSSVTELIVSAAIVCPVKNRLHDRRNQ
jgi:hypothetical protein